MSQGINSTVFNTFSANVDEEVKKFKPIISTGAVTASATKATITITKTTTTTLRTTKPEATTNCLSATATATAAAAAAAGDASNVALATCVGPTILDSATATALATADCTALRHELTDKAMTGQVSATDNGNGIITLSTTATTASANGSPSANTSSSMYKIIKTLGKGNFAKVKLALHIPTGREVAIKIIDKTLLNSSAQQKLHREVGIMKMLNHPNIVRLYQVIETERTLYLIMEYACRGELFDHLVKNGRMKERDARTVFRQLVSAIQYCHSKFVVHRDLKAENLLLDQRMNIKIADFGFGNTFDPKSHLETFCGSPPYAAPELFMGRKYAGPEADAWSLGVVLYTLVSGTLPFDGGTLKELRERVLRGKYRVPYYISMDCENLMRKFLVLNPTKRSTLTGVMSDKWLNAGFDEADWLRPFRESAPLPNDPARVEQLIAMGYNRRDIEHSLQKQRFDDIFCTYVLLGMPRSRRHDAAAVAASVASNVKLNVNSRVVPPRIANGQQPTVTCSTEPPLGLPPAKPTRRSVCKSPALSVHARVDTGLAHKLLPSSTIAAPSPKRLNAIDVKPTLLSTQRQFAQQNKQIPPSKIGTPGRAPRPCTLYEKAEPSSPTVSNIPIGPNFIDRIKISHTPQSESKQKSSSAAKVFSRNSGARATFHFGQARGSKHRPSADCDSGVAYAFAPPHSADDAKPAGRIGFFSKLTARFGRRTLELHDKEYGEHRKTVTK